MDSVYRRQRYIYDFTRKYYLFGRDTLLRELPLSEGQSLVEIGCGTGRNLILIARKHPGVRLFGLDASHEMLKTAQTSIDGAGLTGRIILAHGYAENLTPAMFGVAEPFDHAVFSYSLSMIPHWKHALRQAAAALVPNGTIHAVDFGDLGGFGNKAARLMKAWLELFHVTPRSDIIANVRGVKPLNWNGNPGLRFLPGRYAFLLHCDSAAIEGLLPEDVAGQSQQGGNSDGVAQSGQVPMDFHVPHCPQ
jgi:S-adenosylmethionine-diacylgycerolhomoserine-N-methlytransferase